MIAFVLNAFFVLAAVVAVGVLTDCAMRWRSAFVGLRDRSRNGYASVVAGPRPLLEKSNAIRINRPAKPYPVVRKATCHAA